jgi:hypothetical protein
MRSVDIIPAVALQFWRMQFCPYVVGQEVVDVLGERSADCSKDTKFDGNKIEKSFHISTLSKCSIKMICRCGLPESMRI